MRRTKLLLLTSIGCLPLALSIGCGDEPVDGDGDEIGTGDEIGDGDGDSGDGDGDGDSGDGDGDGDSGDGDGDPGDGDGDPGDGDGDPGDGDGDPGDGDGDSGDGDGDPASVCGDAVIEGAEECEADDLAGMTCASIGFSEGELACGVDCMFDTSACTDSVCGDGMAAADEACDTDDLADQSCEALGYSGGALACLDDCTVDESGCYNAECGNAIIEGDEECDGLELDMQTCGDFGFAVGELACAGDCTVDTSACSMCGNDVIDDPEPCDGVDLGGQTCEGLGYGGGVLACAADCGGLDESGCTNNNDWWGDDFEAGVPLGAEWVLTGNVNWFASGTMPHAGAFNGESGNIDNSQQSSMEVTVNSVAAGDVSFWYRVSTESNWDYLRFYIDGVQQAQWSGVIGWSEQTYPLAAGPHTLRWTYAKDGSVSSNADTVWVDDITTTGAVLP